MVACVTSPTTVARARAVDDLSCPSEALQTRYIGPGTVVISGCGHSAVYTCPQSGRYDRVCIREAENPHYGPPPPEEATVTASTTDNSWEQRRPRRQRTDGAPPADVVTDRQEARPYR